MDLLVCRFSKRLTSRFVLALAHKPQTMDNSKRGLHYHARAGAETGLAVYPMEFML
jgi:hypothetical protein